MNQDHNQHWIWQRSIENERSKKVERNRRICDLRRQGMTFEAIGLELGISMQRASKIWHRDIKRHQQNETP